MLQVVLGTGLAKLPACKLAMQTRGLDLLLAKRRLYTPLQLGYLPAETGSRAWPVFSSLTIQQQGSLGPLSLLCHGKVKCAGAELGSAR